MNIRRLQGSCAEKYVAAFLQKKGFSIVAYNYRLFNGEIDLIAQDKTTLIFVEVKYRTKADVALEYLVPPAKQQKIIATAHHFMATYPKSSTLVCRFDVALVCKKPDDDFLLTYLINAFQSFL